MKIESKNCTLTESLKTHLNSCNQKLQTHFPDKIENVSIHLSIEKHLMIVNLSVILKGKILNFKNKDTDMYKSISDTFDKAIRHTRKLKEKEISKTKSSNIKFEEEVENEINL